MAKIKYTCKWKADCFTSVFLAIFLFSSFSTFVLDSGSKSAVFFYSGIQCYIVYTVIHYITMICFIQWYIAMILRFGVQWNPSL